MGDSHSTAISPSFNGSLKVEGRSEKLTCHAGLVLLREMDERLGLTASLASKLVDRRSPDRIQHSLTQMLRTATYAMAIDSAQAAAAADMGDDAVFKIATCDKKGLSMLDDDAAVASQPTLSRLFAQLSSEENLSHLRTALFDSAVRAVHAAEGKKLDQVTLDIDSYPIPVHGHQAGSEHNGYYRTRCYHPLGVMLGETGHWLNLELRPGAVHTANGAEEMLEPLIDRAKVELSDNVFVRGDAGYVGPEILDMLDEKEVPFAIRLPVNSILRGYEEIHAVRPPGRPPGYERIWCHEIEHRAETWKKARRVVLVVVETPGELFLKSFFIVTSFTKEELCDRDVLDFYRERGTMEGHIGEFQSVIDGSLSSTNRKKKLYRRKPVANPATPIDPERVNAAALCLHGLAFNLLNTFRALAGASDYIDEPPELGLRRARQLLLVAGRIVISARRATLVIMDAALESWRRAWSRIEAFHPPPIAN
jgi:hypothetical protein